MRNLRMILSKGIVLLLLLLAGSLPVLAAEKEKDGIVVWRIEAKKGVSSEDVESLSGYLDSEVEKYSGMRVVSQADIETVLRGEETRQKCGVDDSNSCMVEIGNALGVPEAVSGDLGRLGDTWILNLRRVNIRSVGVIKRISRQAKGKAITSMVDALPGAVAELFGKEEEGMSDYEIAAYSTFFPGVGLVLIGGIGTWQVKDAWDEHKKNGDDASGDRHAAWKGVSTAFYVIGGAAMATGITLWVLDAVGDGGQEQKEAEKKDEPKISFGVAPTRDGFAAGIGGTF